MAAIRTDYQAYIEKLLTAAGQRDAAAKAKRIYDLELKIARAHASREQSEDFTQSADVWAKAAFAKNAPGSHERRARKEGVLRVDPGGRRIIKQKKQQTIH